MSQKSITDFLSNEYKDFAMYTIENRAIPSLVDGFKPVQRKIIHISNQLWKNSDEKTKKVFHFLFKTFDTKLDLSKAICIN